MAGRIPAPGRVYLRKFYGFTSAQASAVPANLGAQLEHCKDDSARRLLLGKTKKGTIGMTNKGLQDLVEQIGLHVNTLARQQNVINKLLTEGIRHTGEQIQILLASSQALLEIAQRHENRLNDLEGEK